MSSYLGRGLEQVDNISKLDNLSFNGGTTYALTKDSSAFQPISSNAILISVSGVIQQGNFTVSGTNIIFNSAVASSESCDFIMHYGQGVAFTPADNSITKDKTNFISNSSSSGVVSKGDGGSVDGSISLNCSQNSHFTKISSSPHSAYSGNLNFVLPSSHGTNGHFLKTDGSGNLSFAEAGGGDLVLLSRVQASGTASEVAFDNVFSTTYTRYLLSIGQCSVDTDTADIRIQWTDNSGSRYTGGHYTGAGKRRDAGNGTDYNQNYIGSASVVIAGDNNNSPNTPAMFHGFIYNNTISDTTDRCMIMGNRIFHSSARHDPMFGFFGASFSQAASVYGFDVFANTGNLQDYDIAIY